jgi:hypothetical protein
MALFLLAPDPAGTCCGCEQRAGPCDTCGEPTECQCALLTPFVTNISQFSSLEQAQGSFEYVTESCLGYYLAYDVYAVFGGSLPPVPIFTGTFVGNVLTFNLSKSGVDLGFQQGIIFSFTCQAGTIINFDFSCSSNGSATEEFPLENFFFSTFTCLYADGPNYTAPDGVVNGSNSLTITEDGTYIGFLSYGPYLNSTSISMSVIMSISGTNNWVVNPVIAKYDDNGTTRQLEACPKLNIPIDTSRVVGLWYGNENEASAKLSSDVLGSGFVYTEVGPIGYSALSASATANTFSCSHTSSIANGNYQTRLWYSISLDEESSISVAWNYSSTGAGPFGTFRQFSFSFFSAQDGSFVANVGGSVPLDAGSWDSSGVIPVLQPGRYIIEVFVQSNQIPGLGSETTSANITLTPNSGTLSGPYLAQALYEVDAALDCPGRLDYS